MGVGYMGVCMMCFFSRLPLPPPSNSYLVRALILCHDGDNARGAIVAVHVDQQVLLLSPHELGGRGEQAEADQGFDRRLLENGGKV